jgi:hypothetical protein
LSYIVIPPELEGAIPLVLDPQAPRHLF